MKPSLVPRIEFGLLAIIVAAMSFGAGRINAAGAATVAAPSPGDTTVRRTPLTGEQIYQTTCMACHGSGGNGAPGTVIGFTTQLPDFTDCNFATRETVADWTAIIRDGGPVRSFSRIMPAFRDLLTNDEIERVITYVHTFCRERGWPRGDLNFPLAQITEKAFPEDEVVLMSRADTRGPGLFENHLIFEKRFGARDQLEVDAPFGFARQPGLASWRGGIGDVSVANKYVFLSSFESGTILSGLAGIVLPTAKQSTGLGNGTTVFEGFLLGGQRLPRRSFFQFQGGVELPTDLARAQRTASWSGVLGTIVPFGPISRIWSPMVEVTGLRELVSHARTEWDIVPEFQISLSALQHVRANIGVDIPLTQKGERPARILVYGLWDTYDGPLFWGWRGWCPGCQH